MKTVRKQPVNSHSYLEMMKTSCQSPTWCPLSSFLLYLSIQFRMWNWYKQPNAQIFSHNQQIFTILLWTEQSVWFNPGWAFLFPLSVFILLPVWTMKCWNKTKETWNNLNKKNWTFNADNTGLTMSFFACGNKLFSQVLSLVHHIFLTCMSCIFNDIFF